MVKSFVAGFGIVEGIRAAFNFAKEARQLAVDAQGVEFAFKRIEQRTGDAEAALLRVKKSTRGLLSDLDIKKAIVELDNFNISSQETDTLLEFLAVRAAQTGQSIDNLKSSLVEGLSKESKLRIDNLGISAKELNEQLEKTPNFVEAVATIAKKEIAEAGDILDDASNSQEKWNADLKNFKLLVGNGFIAKFSDGFNRLGSSILKAVTPTKSLTKEFIDQQSELQTLRFRIINVNTSNEERVRLINELKSIHPDLLSDIDAETASNEDLEKAIKAVNDQLVNKILIAREDDKINEQNEKQADAIENLSIQQKKLNKTVSDGLISAKGFKLNPDRTPLENAEALAQYLDENETFNNQYAEIIRNINFGVNNVRTLQERLNEQEEIGLGLLTEKEALLKRLGIASDSANGSLDNDITEAQKRNIIFLKEAIKKEEEKLDLTTNRAEAKVIQERISLLKKEIDSILGVKNAKQKSGSKRDFGQELIEAELNAEISKQSRIADNEKRSLSKRLEAISLFYDKSFKLLNVVKEKEILAAKGNAKKIELIEFKHGEELDELIRAREQKTLNALKGNFSKILKAREEQREAENKIVNDKVLALEEQLAKDLDNTSLSLEKKLELIKNYEKEVEKIRRESAIKALKHEIKNLERLIRSNETNGQQKIELERLKSAAIIELSNLETEAKIDNIDRLSDKEKKAQETKQKILQETSNFLGDILGIDNQAIQSHLEQIIKVFEGTEKKAKDVASAIVALGQIASSVFSSAMEAANARIDARLEGLEVEKETALKFAGDSAAAKEEIEKRYDAKRRKLKEQQWKNEKKAAVFASIINTASAVVEALPTIPLSIAVGVIGAAQTALIASQEVPKFKTGVKNFKGGDAILGDGGVSEIVRTPDGNVFKTPSKDTLYNLPKGTDVFKNEASFMMELKSLTDMNNIMFDTNLINTPTLPEININNSGLDTDAMRAMFKGLEKTIKNNEGGSIVFDESGYTKYLSKKAGRTKILNDKVLIKGRNV